MRRQYFVDAVFNMQRMRKAGVQLSDDQVGYLDYLREMLPLGAGPENDVSR